MDSFVLKFGGIVLAFFLRWDRNLWVLPNQKNNVCRALFSIAVITFYVWPTDAFQTEIKGVKQHDPF